MFSHRFQRLGLLPILAVLCAHFFSSLGASSQSKPRESFEELARRADDARDADHVQEAISLYREALDQHPEWVEGWWSLGTLQYDSNAYAEAARSFREVIKRRPDHGSAWVMLGLCEYETGDTDQALENLEHGRSLGVTNQEQLYNIASYHIGLLQLRKSQYGSSLKTFQRLAASGVHTDEVALGLAMSLLMMQPAALPAENTTGRAVLLGIGHAEALAAARKNDEARRIYATLVQQYPDYPGLHFAYALFLLNTVSEIEAGTEQLKAELRINPQNAVALLQYAAVIVNDNPSEAIEDTKKALALNPGLLFGHYLLGKFYLMAGNAPAAIPELERARHDMPNEAQVYFSLGSAYAQTGRKQEAERARAEFLRLRASDEDHSANSVRESQGAPAGVVPPTADKP
jgi:predicted Zn-dependent protease